MSTMVERAAKSIADFALHVMRRMTPFFVCLFGMSAPVLFSPGHIWVGMLIAGGAFAWALDMAETRAAAEARVKVAMEITSILVSGSDSTVTVDINHNVRSAALNEQEQG